MTQPIEKRDTPLGTWERLEPLYSADRQHETVHVTIDGVKVTRIFIHDDDTVEIGEAGFDESRQFTREQAAALWPMLQCFAETGSLVRTKEKPKPPLNVCVTFGDPLIHRCPACGSSYPRRYWLFGKRHCINRHCERGQATESEEPKP